MIEIKLLCLVPFNNSYKGIKVFVSCDGWLKKGNIQRKYTLQKIQKVLPEHSDVIQIMINLFIH